MTSKQLFINQIIKITRNLFVVTLSNEGKNYIDAKSLFYMTKKSLPQKSELKSCFNKVIHHQSFRKYINQEKTIEKDSLTSHSQLNGYLTDRYAIMNKKYLTPLMICSRIDTLILKNEKLNIAIDGNSTAGKTTLSKLLQEVYDCNVFHMDDFFKKPDIELKSSYANNIHFKRLKKEVLEPIKQEKDILYRQLDRATHQLKTPIRVSSKSFNIIEGAFSMHPEIIHFYDFKIFMKARYCKQLKRIYKRNGFKKLFVFIKKWIPNENRYIKNLNIKNQADLVIELKNF